MSRKKGRTLTPAQQEVYEFICEYKAENDGISPTEQEIAEELHRSVSTARYLVLKLLTKGVIYRIDERRAIAVTGGTWTPPRAPDFSGLDR